MTSTFPKSSQNDYINNLFKQELFNSKEVNIANFNQVLNTLQDTSNQLGQSLRVNVKSQLGSFFSIHKKNTQVYEQGQKNIQEALSSSHDILLQDAKIAPKTTTSHFLTTQSKFQHCRETITSLQYLINVSQQLDNVYTIITSQQQSKLVEAIQQIFSILKQINATEKNEHIIAWQGLKQKAIQYREWVTSLVHDGLSECIVYNSEHFDNSSNANTSNIFQSSIIILSCTKLNGTAFYLTDLLHATILLDIQHSELASIQRQLIKYFIDPFLSIQRTSGPSIKLSIDEQEEEGCIKRSLYITKRSSNSNNDEEVSLTKKHHDRCTDAEKMLQHTDLVMQFIFNGIFNNSENNAFQSSLEPLRQLFGHLLLPHVLDTLVTKAMVPTISLSSNSLSDLPIALNDLDVLAKMAVHFEKQWIIDYAHLHSEDDIDLPLGKYVNRFDQHVAYQRRSQFLNDARKIMLRKVYDAEEHSDTGKITQTPKILLTMVQQMIQEIQLLSSELDKYPETVATLRNTIQEVIMLYITIMPSFHRHLFLQHASHAIVFHNDCYWLADSMAALEFQDNNEAILTNLRRLGDTWKRIVIAQFMTKVDAILNKTEEWHHSALSADLHLQQQHQQHNKEVVSFDNAIELVIHQTNIFITDISNVIIKRQCKAFLISITNDILKKIIDGILGMGDIAADTSRTMAQALNGLAQLATLFSKVIEIEESVNEVTLRQWVPNWQPFWMLKDMLDMTMADILDALYRGDLAGFTHDQLTHLVCSLFSDTPRRDETVRIIKSSDLSGALQKSISSPTLNSQASQSKRSISLTNPHNEQPTKRSFLERLLIPEDEAQQQQLHSINNQPTSDPSINFNLKNQYKNTDTFSDEEVDTSSYLKNTNQTPSMLQQNLSNDRFSFNESVDNDEWNQNSNWSDDNDGDDGGGGKSSITYGEKNNKSISKNTSTYLISQQKYDSQNNISDNSNYNENLVDAENKWDESDTLELLTNDHDFKNEIERETNDNHDDKGVLNFIQKSTVNSKFSFNEALNNENDGWGQYDDPLDITTDQFGNDGSADLVPMETKEFSHNQLPAVSSKFEYSECLDENGWSESELLDVDVDVTNNENNTRLIEYGTANSIDKQMKISTHTGKSEDDDHVINESNQSPSHSQVQINLQPDTSTDSKVNMDNFSSNDTSDILNLVTDEKNVDVLTSIKHEEELFEKLANGQQQQRFDNSNKFIINDNLHQEAYWDEGEPLYTNIENMHDNTNFRQQDQPEYDDNDDDGGIVKANDVNSDKRQLDLLNVTMDKGEVKNNISNAYETTDIEKQIPKYDNANLNEDNQDDHNMDLLEQGLYGPSQPHHQHLPLFDDTTKLDNDVNELEQLESLDKNVTTDDNIKDIKLDSYELTAENVTSGNDNKSTNINEPISKSSITDNNKNSELYKVEPKAKNDINYIIDDSLILNKSEQVAKSAIEDNLEHLAEEIANNSDNGEENIILDRSEPSNQNPNITNNDNGNNESIELNQAEAPIENIAIYDDSEKTKLEQLEQADKNITIVSNDESTILIKLESAVENNITENIEYSTSNQLESTNGVMITNDYNNNIVLSQSELVGNNISNDNVEDNEGSSELDGSLADDYENNAELDSELIEKILPGSDQSQVNFIYDNMVESEKTQEDPANSYDESELAVNVNENVHVLHKVDQVTHHSSIESEDTSNDKHVESLSLNVSVKNDDQTSSNESAKSNLTLEEEIIKPGDSQQLQHTASDKPGFDIIVNHNERCDNFGSILLVDDKESKKKLDSLEDTEETFISDSAYSNSNLLDVSTSIATSMGQDEVNVTPINEQKLSENSMESDSVLNSTKYNQPGLLDMGVDHFLEHSKNGISEYAAIDSHYSTEHCVDEQLIKSEQLQQQPHLSSQFVFDDTLLEDGWDQDDIDLKKKLDEMNQPSLKTEESSTPDIQLKSDVKLIKENFVVNEFENTRYASEETTSSLTNDSLKRQQKQEHGPVNSRFSFNNNLADDEEGWDEDNILDDFVSNNITGTPNMNVIKQTKSNLSQDQYHQQPALSSKFRFNDTIINDDGWDQEESLDAMLNSTPINTKLNEQPRIESTQMKEQQYNIYIDGWAQDESLNVTANDTYIEENKIITPQLENNDKDNNGLSHSKLLYSEIKNEISEGMSTKLERTKPNAIQQQLPEHRPEHQPSFANDRFTFDGLSDDGGWEQDNGWLDDDVDNFILTTTDSNAGSSSKQNKQPNQISTELDKQQNVAIKSYVDKKQKDTKKTTISNPNFISSTTFAFNDNEEPVGWSDADEDIF